MKQIFKFFFLIFFIASNAQEIEKKDSKLDQTKTQDWEKNYLELKSPLNLVQCKNCISENPIIDLKELNDDSKFKQLLNDVINLNSIAFNIILDKDGRIIEFKPNYEYSSFSIKVPQSKFNKLDVFAVNKKILFISNVDLMFIKTTLLFNIENNQISLNSVLH